MNNLRLREEDLMNNPTTRVIVTLCTDTSSSMAAVEGDDIVYTGKTVYRDGKTWNVVTGGATRIDELNKGMKLLRKTLEENDVAKYSAELCLVKFADSAECVLDFASLERQEQFPELVADGMTRMGEGVNLALDKIEEAIAQCEKVGVDYFTPWLVIMTDGQPNGSSAELARAEARIRKMVEAKKLIVLPIAIGNEADQSALAKLSPDRAPVKLRGLRFKEFFEWLSKSIERTSNSMPGEIIPLDTEGIFNVNGWGEL